MFGPNKKRILIFSSVALVLVVGIFVWVTNKQDNFVEGPLYTSKHTKQLIQIEEGGVFSIRLTGCGVGVAPWYRFDHKVRENEGFELVRKHQIPHPRNMDGGRERYVYVFRALQPGTHEIAFDTEPRYPEYQGEEPDAVTKGTPFVFQLEVK